MTYVIRNLLRDEERAVNILVWGCGAVCASCLLASLVAMAVLRQRRTPGSQVRLSQRICFSGLMQGLPDPHRAYSSSDAP